LPIGGLNVLEVIHRIFVVLVNSLAEDDERIPDEQMSDVVCESVIDAYEGPLFSRK
jgi:hypothetical protein